MELTDRDREILDFERSWWSHGGPKETLVLERFELSAARYYEVLNQLIDSDEAYRHDPLVVRRLRRMRERRRRSRQDTTSEARVAGDDASVPTADVAAHNPGEARPT